MPNKKRKHGKASNKQPKAGAGKNAAVSMNSMPASAQEETKVSPQQSVVNCYTLDLDEQHALSTLDIKAMVDRTAEYADSNYQLSSLGDLHSHMQNTISMMRGDKTITETTASVSNEGGGIKLLHRNARGEGHDDEDDELALSQLASAVNQISAVHHHNVSLNQQNLPTGQGMNMIQLEDNTEIDVQYLQKTQIYDDSSAHNQAMLSNMFESSALQYEKVQQAPLSHENTFIREEAADNSAEQIKLFTPLLLQQLMLNSEQILNQNLSSSREKNFAPFDFTESMLDGEANKVEHLIGGHFDETTVNDSSEPAPVLGLNLREYFQKRHLVDQLPVEPLPPIENPLEMTQNHEDWVRGQEDFKINLEQLQGLQQADKDGKGSAFASEVVGDAASNVFNPVAQKELAVYNENMKSAASSFDIKSWETLTQAHRNFRKNTTNAKIQEMPAHGLSQTKNEDSFRQLLELEKHGASRRRSKNDQTSQSMLFTASVKAGEEEKTDPGAFLAQELDAAENLSSQSLLTQTFIEHAKPDQLDAITNTPKGVKSKQEAFMNTALESSISKDVDRDSQDNLECFISQPELQQLLQLESSLFNLLQETNISDFMVPNRQGQPDAASDFNDEEYESFFEPQAPQIGGSLKNLENFLIKGDLRNCVLCNSTYSEGDAKRGQAANLPRVLYCGDSLCESCILKHIQRASISSGSNIQNVAACQVICPVCDVKHIFKLTKTGFLVCNDKYIKVQDEKGPVNFFPSSKINPSTFQLDKDTLHLNLMDNSISIPNSLVVRSLPVNVELLELLKTKRKVSNPSQIELSSISNQQESPIRPRSSSTCKSETAVLQENPRKQTLTSRNQQSQQELLQQQKIDDLEEHMEAFNVEEFVREYEKEILQRLSSHDNLRGASSEERQAASLALLQRTASKQKDNLLSAFDETEEVATNKMLEQEHDQTTTLEHPADLLQPSRSQIGINTFSTIMRKQQDMSQTLQGSHQQQNMSAGSLASSSNPKQMLADLHDRFEGKKESFNGLEEKARKRKEQQRSTQKVGTLRKKVSQQQGKPQAFKSHQYSSSGSASIQTLSAGNNASAQAIFKQKRKKKYLFMKERRDSSYSTSSDEQQNLLMIQQHRSSHIASSVDPRRTFNTMIGTGARLPQLFQGAGASPVYPADSYDNIMESGSKNENQVHHHQMMGTSSSSSRCATETMLRPQEASMGDHQQHDGFVENLIPLELDDVVETLGQSTATVLMTQCDRLSDGSDLSPEEIASENSLKRVSMEMLQASQQVLPPQLFPNEETARMFMSSVLEQQQQASGSNEEFNMKFASSSLQTMPMEEQQSVEKKRQMRWAQEERRREKKKNNKEAEIEESKKLKDAMSDSNLNPDPMQALREYSRVLQQSRQLEEEMKAVEQASKTTTSDGPQTIPDYAYFVSQLAQQQAAQQTQTQEDSASKKKARRNKKKRRRQQMLLQAQQLAELMNGHQVSEDCEADLYTMLVPVEETQLQPDPDSKQGAVKLKYVLSERDVFNSEMISEADGQSGANVKSGCVTLEAPDLSPSAKMDPQMRISISCSACCQVDGSQMMWYRCDPKSQENVSFAVFPGQADAGNAFQFTKTQLQVLKELVDLGLMNLPSHYCETCNASAMQTNGVGGEPVAGAEFKDVSKLCFCCTIQHRLDHPSHHLAMIMPLQLLTLQIKRSEHMEHSVRHMIGKLQQSTAENQISTLVAQLQNCFLGHHEDQQAATMKKDNEATSSSSLPHIKDNK